MRLFFLQQPKIGQAAPVTAVFSMLYFGSEGIHEYVSLYYDPIIVQQANREILLFRDDDTRSRRLPTIRLKLNDDNSEMVGTMVSTSESVVGNVSLRSGWDFGVGNYISEVGGIYDASNCERLDGAAMHFEQLELIPSRVHQEKIVPEGMFGKTNFIGNGLCRRLGHVNCVNFSSGSYNFVKGRVDLHHGSWDWVCQRSGANELDCTSLVMNVEQPL